MLKPTIKLNKDLWEKLERCSAARGYNSPEEFVEHVLEKEVAAFEESESNEDIARRLKALSYLE
jgi:metal-responsive CopG/Arc/MetJ family transcriptional regulator